jgi:hypothetical protein
MIAVALGLIGLVIMIATGVAASSTGGDHLTFLGVGVQTTTAQVFLTGAIFGWVFVIALWLLRVGIHRSGERCAQLAARRGRRASEWLGFGEPDADDDAWSDWDEWGFKGRRPDGGQGGRGSGRQGGGPRVRNAAVLDGEGVLRERTVGRTDAVGRGRSTPGRSEGGLDQANRVVKGESDGVLREQTVGRTGVVRHGRGAPWDPDGGFHQAHRAGDGAGDGVRSERIVGRAGAAGHGRGAPWRPDGGPDAANRAVAGAAEQPRAVSGGHPPGPAAGRLPGIGVRRGAQGRQIGGDPGPVPGEDRDPEGQQGAAEGCQ